MSKIYAIANRVATNIGIEILTGYDDFRYAFRKYRVGAVLKSQTRHTSFDYYQQLRAEADLQFVEPHSFPTCGLGLIAFTRELQAEKELRTRSNRVAPTAPEQAPPSYRSATSAGLYPELPVVKYDNFPASCSGINKRPKRGLLSIYHDFYCRQLALAIRKEVTRLASQPESSLSNDERIWLHQIRDFADSVPEAEFQAYLGGAIYRHVDQVELEETLTTAEKVDTLLLHASTFWNSEEEVAIRARTVAFYAGALGE